MTKQTLEESRKEWKKTFEKIIDWWKNLSDKEKLIIRSKLIFSFKYKDEEKIK